MLLFCDFYFEMIEVEFHSQFPTRKLDMNDLPNRIYNWEVLGSF